MQQFGTLKFQRRSQYTTSPLSEVLDCDFRIELRNDVDLTASSLTFLLTSSTFSQRCQAFDLFFGIQMIFVLDNHVTGLANRIDVAFLRCFFFVRNVLFEAFKMSLWHSALLNCVPVCFCSSQMTVIGIQVHNICDGLANPFPCNAFLLIRLATFRCDVLVTEETGISRAAYCSLTTGCFKACFDYFNTMICSAVILLGFT